MGASLRLRIMISRLVKKGDKRISVRLTNLQIRRDTYESKLKTNETICETPDQGKEMRWIVLP